MSILLMAFGVAWLLTLLALRLAKRYSRLSYDHDLSGPQKIHAVPVPRIGGAGIFLGCLAGLLVAIAQQKGSVGGGSLGLWLLVAALPAFLAGMTEDLTKDVSPRRRLAATAASAMLAAYLLGAVINRSGLPGVDSLLGWSAVALMVTVVVVAGIANAVNIIDGFNGLASMCSVIMLAGMAYVAYQVGDVLLYSMALAGIGAVLGFFLWNYPAGYIFLGDGGAYFLGFYVAELGILLLVRNPTVSPMFPLLICIYPVFETLFSIYRRVVVRGRPSSMPDGIHLHSLVFKRLMRWAVGTIDPHARTQRNSLTSPYLWFICMLSVVPAVMFWDQTWILLGLVIVFACGYVCLYARIVRFRTPRWLIFRR
ncbi:MraY family glycosyltransferase [Ideonella sp.]|uniref:MraY family glycosyltransferase n=1 Tax=Ideonella sp. TaxID=1929293 RepID=UPI003BB49D65